MNHLTTDPGAVAHRARPTFIGVQALRGVAAMLVVAMHADQMWNLRVDPLHSEIFWSTGAAGVDIFFVISGFVMIVSTQHLVQERDWRSFAWRRLSRIVPLYWAATTLKVVSVLAVPSLALHTVLSPGGVVASYLFFPWPSEDGGILPILPVGWTLDLEMAFYALFALALASGVGLLPVILPCLVVAAALSPFVASDWPGMAFYCDPIVLEFAAGLCLGALTLRGRRLATLPAAIAVVGGFALLVFLPPMQPRILLWGVPAALIVAGTIGLEGQLWRVKPRWLLRFGAASYSTYLFHSFVLVVLGIVLQQLSIPLSISWAIAIVFGCTLSVLCGELCRRALERPWAAALKRLRAT